jgi:PAS domain S-box-containing protein
MATGICCGSSLPDGGQPDRRGGPGSWTSTSASGRKGFRRLATIVESSDDAIIGQPDGTITSWNPGRAHLRLYRREVVGKPIRFSAPDRPDEMAQILEKLRAGERVEQFETVRICKHGGGSTYP